MPRFDRTGPSGQGARSGKQKGHCAQKTAGNEEVTTNERPLHKRLRLNTTAPKGLENRFGRGNHQGNQNQ